MGPKEHAAPPKPLFVATGWPWQQPCARLFKPALSAAGPRITVVMPSYNQGAFIEKAIRSVLLQDYPNWELIIMDGGSKDDSVRVIRYYADWLAYWQSGRDGGQSQAINLGMSRATGDLVAWLNSDDFYLPGAFRSAAKRWCPGQLSQWIVGVTDFRDEKGGSLYEWAPSPSRSLGEALSLSPGVPQTSCFWSLDLWQVAGGLDESLHYCMDEDLFMKFYLAGARPVTLPEHLAVMVIQPASKTAAQQPRFARDFARIVLGNRSRVPAGELGQWRAGLDRMAENYGLYGWQCLSRKDLKGMVEYLRAGASLSIRSAARGIFRGTGSALKRRLVWQ